MQHRNTLQNVNIDYMLTISLFSMTGGHIRKNRRSGEGVNDNDHFPFQATGNHKTSTHFSFQLDICAGSADTSRQRCLVS